MPFRLILFAAADAFAMMLLAASMAQLAIAPRFRRAAALDAMLLMPPA